MSIQGNKLKAIADAIREKDGTTEPIVANTFPDRIRAIQTGGDVQVETMTITSMPTKLTYNIGETFDPTGISVTIKLNNGYTFVANDEHLSYGIDGAFTSAGSQTVPVRFSWGSEITEKTISVTVNRITLTVPVQSGTLTYNGNEQSPTWSGYDSTKMSISGMTTSTNAGSFVATFTLIGNNYQWTDGSTGPRNVSWTINKAPSEMTLNAYTVTLDKEHLSATIEATKTGTSGAITAVSNNTDIATVSVSGNTITITSVNEKTGNVEVTVSAAEDANYLAPTAKTVAVTAKFVTIYGVQWPGGTSTKWTRTDASANFSDPIPYMSGATNYGSPFDNLMPWSGMTVSERTGGTMVAIPKFWYKLESYGNGGLKIQIADGPLDGFCASPAHTDRGDGVGERDIVYVSRYLCSSKETSTVYSTTGKYPRHHMRNTLRSWVHWAGDTLRMFDYTAMLTIQLLYLVEFADWDSQRKIGVGFKDWKQDNYYPHNSTGTTDKMPYHTGTTANKIEAIGNIQYRNIEDLWGNGTYWIDGTCSRYNSIYIAIDYNNFAINDPNSYYKYFSHTSAWNNYPTKFAVYDLFNIKIFFPTEASGSNSKGMCDYMHFQTYDACEAGGKSGFRTSDGTEWGYNFGLFYLCGSDYEQEINCCRSIELPNNS